MGFADDREWDRYRNDPRKPGYLSKEKKVKLYLGFSVLSMAMFLALLYFSP